jgi:hypothetical protein
MRTEIIDYLGTLNLGTYKVAGELPFDDNGQPLYIKNVKRIYVDTDEITDETVISTLDGVNIINETTTVRVYFATDAKNLTSNYDAVVNSIKGARSVSTITGVHVRNCNIAKSYTQDLLLTQFDFEFTKLI